MANGNEVARCYVTIVPTMQGAQKAIAEQMGAPAEKAGEESGKKFGEKFSDGFGKVAKAVGTAAVAAAGAAVTGITKLTTEAVKAYGEYEQLVGGVEKLFGDSADIIAENASKAFETSGLSANKYMETVTSFSAALINSLGGDTEAAANLADTAIRDMSDNANTFGTDMETVMGVYNSLSKGMFTTLDNLKLGFAGTAEGAKDLIKSAEELDTSFKAERDSTGELTLSYADMVNAIHIVQENMNIAGTTSNEAATTIQGSMSMLSASWQNLITGLGNGSADLGALVDDVVSSALSVVNNIKPIATQAIKGLASLVTQAAPIIAEELPSMVEELTEPLSGAVISLVNSLAPQLPTIMGAITTIITQLMPVFMNVLPIVISSVFELIMGIVSWLSTGENVETLVNGIVALVSGLVNQFAMILPVLLPAIIGIIGDVCTTLTTPENIELLIDACLTIIGAIVVALINAVPEIIDLAIGVIENLGNLFGDFLSWIVPLIAGGLASIIESIKSWANNIKNKATELTVSVLSTFSNWINNLKTAFSNGFNAIKTNISNIIEKIKGFVTTCVNTIKSLPEKIKTIGKNLVEGLWNGINDKIGWVKQKISSMGSAITSAIKKVFGIASPSKVWKKEVGRYLADGLAIGFVDEMDAVESDIIDRASELTGNMTASVEAYAPQPSSVLTGNEVNNTYGGNISINVYGAEGQSETTLAEAIADKLGEMTRRRGAVYA